MQYGPSPQKLATTALIVAFAVLSTAQVNAQDTSPGELTSPRGGGYAGGEATFGKLDEDFFLGVNLVWAFRLQVPKAFCHGYFPIDGEEADAPSPGVDGGADAGLDKDKKNDECRTDLTTGFRVPLRFRIVDRAPKDEGLVRSEDWDEVGDYLKIVRFVEYGHKREPLHLRVGELGGVVIGHGTIMNRYFNVIDVDHYQLGFTGDLNSRHGGIELVLDNFIDPEVMGYRVYARPITFVEPSSWWTRWAVGTSLLLDVDAPTGFERINVLEDDGMPFAVDDAGRLVPSKTEVTGVFGIDNELLLIQEPLVDFIPYLDINFSLDGSPGAHLGALTNLRPAESFSLYSRLELRWVGENYIPDYFSSLYEIERDAFFGWQGGGAPKLTVLRNQDRGSVFGAYGELTFDFIGLAQITGAYEDYQGPENASLLLRAQLPRIGPVVLGALYRKTGFDGIDNAFELKDALLVAEARYFVTNWVYLLAQWSRLWRLKDGADLQDDNPYRTVDNWFIGGGVAVGF